jgi:hypothetical protein
MGASTILGSIRPLVCKILGHKWIFECEGIFALSETRRRFGHLENCKRCPAQKLNGIVVTNRNGIGINRHLV